jgi:hypothetical protein
MRGWLTRGPGVSRRAVDIRWNSRTLGRWFGLEASDEDRTQVWSPAGFARGLLQLSKKETEVALQVHRNLRIRRTRPASAGSDSAHHGLKVAELPSESSLLKDRRRAVRLDATGLRRPDRSASASDLRRLSRRKHITEPAFASHRRWSIVPAVVRRELMLEGKGSRFKVCSFSNHGHHSRPGGRRRKGTGSPHTRPQARDAGNSASQARFNTRGGSGANPPRVCPRKGSVSCRDPHERGRRAGGPGPPEANAQVCRSRPAAG